MTSTPASGGGLLNWLHGKKKAPGRSNSFQSRSMADSPLPAAPPLLLDSSAASSVAPPPTLSSAHSVDAELTSTVRLILHTELHHIIAENLVEIARRLLLPPSDQQLEKLQQAPRIIQKQLLLQIEDLQIQLKESEQKQIKLQEEVELLNPERNELTTGTFAEAAPSLSMLQDAHNAMCNALLTLAAKVNDQVKAKWPEIRSKSSIFIRQFCYCFFIDFETTSLGESQRNPGFQRPDKDLKHRLFKEYLDYRTENECRLFDAAETNFRSFCGSRFRLLSYNNNESTPFKSQEQRNSVLGQLLKQECPLFVDFVGLAKTVWLLHKLAFAFEPSAEIFRVNEGCHYDPEYMVVLVDGDTESAKRRGAAAEIGLMAAPGFTVMNVVIKALVQFKGTEA